MCTHLSGTYGCEYIVFVKEMYRSWHIMLTLVYSQYCKILYYSIIWYCVSLKDTQTHQHTATYLFPLESFTKTRHVPGVVYSQTCHRVEISWIIHFWVEVVWTHDSYVYTQRECQISILITIVITIVVVILIVTQIINYIQFNNNNNYEKLYYVRYAKWS